MFFERKYDFLRSEQTVLQSRTEKVIKEFVRRTKKRSIVFSSNVQQQKNRTQAQPNVIFYLALKLIPRENIFTVCKSILKGGHEIVGKVPMIVPDLTMEVSSHECP